MRIWYDSGASGRTGELSLTLAAATVTSVTKLALKSTLSKTLDGTTTVSASLLDVTTLDTILAYVEANLPVPTVSEISDAVWGHATALDFADKMLICSRIMRNKTVTDPTTGVMTVYADDGTTPYLTAQLYEDATETQTYRGQGAEVRRRLV